MDGLAGPYAAFIQAAAASGAAVPDTGASGAPRPRVLDLASGSGVPATTLARGLRARPDGPALALSLTDLVPRPDVWAASALVCDDTANASCSARVIGTFCATFSAVWPM